MPLKVLIVGAGLGGLGAAIALGQSGHEVLVFEHSKFLHEVGAAIHVPPNASRILSSWGLDFEAMQAVRCERLQVWNAMGNHLWTPIVTEDYQRSLGISDGWFLTHRVDLHNALRATAARQDRVQIRLSSRVAYVDADAGVVTLEDGSTFTGDLVLGADGIHSKSVSAITGEEQRKECTGQNCFRFLVPVSKLQANPLTTSFLEKVKLDGMHAFTSPDRRLLMYPCCGGTLLNMAGIFPSDTMARATNTSWLQSGNLEDLLKTFQDFSPELLEICRQAEDVKLWSLATRQAARTFVRGKLALMGDAAHPTLPHQGQGGAQAFEDAAALGALFPRDTTPGEVAHRLMLYNKTRYDRSITVMMMSKVPHDQREQMLGELRTYVPNAEIPEDMWTYTWPSDPAHEARCLLVSA